MKATAWFVSLLGVGLVGCVYPKDEGGFTKEEVAEIRAQLRARTEITPATVNAIKAQVRQVAPENYRIVVPVFDRERLGAVVIGSETIGTLPITQVQRLASLRGVDYDENANAQAVIWQPGASTQGGGGGGGQGGGGQGGCQSDHSTPAQGLDIGSRILEIVEHIDQSKYVFLH